ncbi:MAG: RNA polymerase factor sigma-54 [Prevotella sp.]|nr:RNA polymerase factor sigma-54 [Prevotella sp.]
MAQEIIQTQEQKLAQQQRLSQQQMLQVKLLEMPLAELEQKVRMELDDNPALESKTPEQNDNFEPEAPADDKDDGMNEYEREERQDEINAALERLGSDDEMPEMGGYGRGGRTEQEYEQMPQADQNTFYDTLKEQMDMLDITEKQKQIMLYIIYSLESSGLLRKALDDISDELAIYQNVDASEQEIEEVLKMLQDFDPAGIGARSLQECLLLQLDRMQPTEWTRLTRRVVDEYFDDFINRRWDRIVRQLNCTEDDKQHVMEVFRKLNPKPGSALGESASSSTQQVMPDFTIDVDEEGNVSFSINQGEIPELNVSSYYLDMMDEYQRNRDNMNRKQREALLYLREKVERARGYIEAVRQRHRTLYVTMKTIIELQHKYFVEGDESELRPMVLKDVAERTGLDISTISRVCNAKYAQTPWGIFPLRHFFSEGVQTGEGEETSIHQLKAILKEIIDGEDKHHPLSDDAISKEMERRGFGIARRTVTKYREHLGIPKASLRKE